MKKIYNILLLTLTLGLASCVGEVDDIFSESSANRAAEALITNREVLLSAPNGWRLEMKADPDNEFELGAYNLFLKFNADSTVSVGSELGKADSVITSHFKLYQSQGINLSFDEYNEYVHFFSNPIGGLNLGTTAGKGLKGDLEFLILKATKNEVILKGKKSDVKMRMVPVERGIKWSEEIDSIATVEDSISRFDAYYLTFADTKDTVLLSRKNRTFSYVNKDGETTILPYVVTMRGIEFLKTENIAGHNVTGFGYTKGALTYKSLENDGTSISVVKYTPAKSFESTDWYFAKSAMSSTLAYFYGTIANAIANQFPVRYTAMYIDYDDVFECDRAVLFLNCGGYGGCIYFKYTHIDDNTIKLEIYENESEEKEEGEIGDDDDDDDDDDATPKMVPYDANGEYFYGWGFSYFANALNGTYTLTPNNELAPDELLFVNNDNAALYFKLSKKVIANPNDK